MNTRVFLKPAWYFKRLLLSGSHSKAEIRLLPPHPLPAIIRLVLPQRASPGMPTGSARGRRARGSEEPAGFAQPGHPPTLQSHQQHADKWQSSEALPAPAAKALGSEFTEIPVPRATLGAFSSEARALRSMPTCCSPARLSSSSPAQPWCISLQLLKVFSTTCTHPNGAAALDVLQNTGLHAPWVKKAAGPASPWGLAHNTMLTCAPAWVRHKSRASPYKGKPAARAASSSKAGRCWRGPSEVRQPAPGEETQPSADARLIAEPR